MNFYMFILFLSNIRKSQNSQTLIRRQSLARGARAAYGMAEDVDPLAFLLELNLTCAAREKAGEKITPPGLPVPASERASFITDDCIQPPEDW